MYRVKIEAPAPSTSDVFRAKSSVLVFDEEPVDFLL